MIINEQTIWFPDSPLQEYERRIDGGYSLTLDCVRLPQLTELVQARAQEDGEWIIASGLVGEDNENEDKMRRMMAWVSDVKNISQCLEHILADHEEAIRDVDWVCRELATASKMMIR